MLIILLGELFCLVLIYMWTRLQDVSITYEDEKLYDFSVNLITVWLVWMLVFPMLYILFTYIIN